MNRIPSVATSLFNALCDAKAIAARKCDTRHAALYAALACREIEKMTKFFGADAWPYGVDANRPTLEALMHICRNRIDRAGRADRFIVRTDLRAGSKP